MRSYRIAVGILAVLMGLSIYLYFYVQDSAEMLQSEAQSILAALKEDDTITEEIKSDIYELSGHIKKELKIWNYIINQVETEKALAAINACIGYASTETSPDVVYSLYQFCFYAENIFKRETVTFPNIF